jgi:hypothetical protein
MGDRTDTPAKRETGTGTGWLKTASAEPTRRPRGRWRVITWGLSAAWVIAMWAFLFAANAAHLAGAYLVLGLVFWTGLIVEGLVAALLDGFVDYAHVPGVAATAWTHCTRCGGGVPFAAGERQARCPYCDATVLPPTGRRAILGLRALFQVVAGIGILVGAANASHAPLVPDTLTGFALATACIAGVAFPFRRYLRNQPG